MLKKFLLLAIALITLGSVGLTHTPVTAAAATTHLIHDQGKTYRSKYTISQMRHRYHLRHYKSRDSSGVIWNHNWLLGITKGANIHVGTRGETHAQGNRHLKGNFAEFITDQENGGNAYSATYVNLKTGKAYHDQA